MKIQEGGNEHSIGDKNCPGCESPEGEQFPQPHRDPVTNCLGLVHAEIFAELFNDVSERQAVRS